MNIRPIAFDDGGNRVLAQAQFPANQAIPQPGHSPSMRRRRVFTDARPNVLAAGVAGAGSRAGTCEPVLSGNTAAILIDVL